MGYRSIGCVICSTPTLPHEDARAGRWRWFNALDGNNKECGIHTNTMGGGI
jgi:phosphoadenosine phosphosulfate reductase